MEWTKEQREQFEAWWTFAGRADEECKEVQWEAWIASAKLMGELAVGGQWISVIGEEPPTPIKEEMWDADRKRSHAIEKSKVHICIRWGSRNRWYMFRAVFCKAGPLGGNHWYKAGSQTTEYPDYFMSIPPFPEPIDNGADELNVALGYDDTHELYASYDDSDSLPAPSSGEQGAKPKKLTLTEAARIASGKDMQPPSKPIRFAAVPVGNQERRDEEGI